MRTTPIHAVVAAAVVTLVGACATDSDPSQDSEAFDRADLHEGGRLYDNIWAVPPPEDFLDDHPLWADRPDDASNASEGADTWRCKECHGWDYRGVDGAYGSGENRTGFAGILGTSLDPQEAFDLISLGPNDVGGGHGYGQVLDEREIWDLVKFALEGVVDTTDIIDGDGAFIGDIDRGQDLFTSGIGTEPACAGCHGTDGLTMPHVDEHDEGGDEHDESVGGIAAENPWEFHHKARFGHPGTPMHGYQRGGASHEDMANLGAFAQTLPGG